MESEIVISDNGTQYSSEQFKDFSEQYKFKHVTSSPHFPRSNGKAEKTVQIAKNLLKKAKKEGSDPYLAILDYRNTPIDGLDASPAQMLMQRRTRTTLPTASKLLKPKVVQNVHENLKLKQETQKRYFDRGTKQLPLFKEGERVKMRLPNKSWKDAKVVTKSTFPRSYVVECEGRQYRRNRVDLRKCANNKPLGSTSSIQKERNNNNQSLTRSGQRYGPT